MFAPALVPLFLILSACTFRTPLLDPEPSRKFEKGEAITVSVRQVAAEDRKRFRVDLSAYYTPFLVIVSNRSDFSVLLNPFEARLTVVSREGRGSVYPALDLAAAIEYYRKGDFGHRSFILVPKTHEVSERELAKIEGSMLQRTTIPPGGEGEGVILFKKITAHSCGEVVLSLPRVSVLNQEKEFAFGFSCRK